MERSLTKSSESLNYRLEDDSIVIPDSDEDIVGSSRKMDERIAEDANASLGNMIRNHKFIDDTPIIRLARNIIDENYKIDSDDSDYEQTNNYEDDDEEYYTTSDLYTSSSITDTTISDFNRSDSDFSYSPIKTKGKKRKDVTHDNTKENIKKLKSNFLNKSLTYDMNFINTDNSHKQNNIDYKIANEENKAFHDVSVTVELDSDSNSAQNGEFDTERRLQECIRKQKEIGMLTHELENTPLVPFSSSPGTYTSKKVEEQSRLMNKMSTFLEDESYSDEYSDCTWDSWDIDLPFGWDTTSMKLGKKAQGTRDKELALTVERLQDLHGSLITRPSENEKAEDPSGLTVQLMPHQQHALTWLLWREGQKPSGGVLADDMGLGKTLTMIALIMITLDKKDLDEGNHDNDNHDDKWINGNKPSYHKGGTLVVCPASLLSQWENEIRNKCNRGLLSVEVHHGSNRQTVPKKLAKNNIVITTYNILSREHKNNSTLYKINWERVILDEAHIVRNYKSQGCKAVCGLVASKRWALTGTPIQNKELDLYSILKFLQCSPFDDLRVWKRWVDKNDDAGQQRLATVMKTLMLRRTKQELMAKGDLESLPDKSIEEVKVQLDCQEKLVYEKILVYSRTLFAQFLAQRAEKEHMFNLYSGKYDKPAYLSNPNKETQFTKAQNKLLSLHADVKTHEILVLLLRLRQVCCHPALIHAMLDQEDVKQSGIMDMENVDADLLSGVNNMLLNGIDNVKEYDIGIDLNLVGNLLTTEKEDIGIDQKVVGNLLTAENPVFDNDRISSKMKALLDLVIQILQKGDDKLIIVSQWTKLLDVIASHLSTIKGATFSKFTGSVAIKDRQNIIQSFNNQNSGSRILLLSLTAGGVGLNLVGGNHLLLFDIHWNPQLETQAQDRIYRFGQTKNVYIYRFICVNTIEERIKALQERKLKIARNVLSGNGSNASTKLTLNDLKSLFGF